MFPIGDHHPPRTTPFITYLLIGINILVFVYMFFFSPVNPESVITTYGLIPAEIVQGQDLITLITSIFMHASVGHIFGNMLFLHIFGDNLEDTLGHVKYLFFYLLSGLGASALQILIDPSSVIPNLGASGAIAGLMGGYLYLFPNHRIDVILPLGFFFSRTTVPAYTMLLYWIVFQFFFGLGSLSDVSRGGVAYFAHIGGFITGLILIFLLPKSRSGQEYYREA